MKLATINRAFAALLTAAGAVLVAGSIGVLLQTRPMLSSLHQVKPSQVQLATQCRAVATRLGFSAPGGEDDGNLRISLPGKDLRNLEHAFDRASVVVSMCRGFEIHAFCAGVECKNDALFLVLRPKH